MYAVIHKFIDKKIQPLFFIMLFDQSALSMTVPLLTLVFFDHNSHLLPANTPDVTRALFYGLCLSIHNVLTMVISPIISVISDKVDRKLCLSLCVLGALLFALIASIGLYFSILYLFIASAIIRGLFTKTNPIALSIVGEVSSAKNKLINMSTLQVAISLGAFIGPVAGGFLAGKALSHHYSYSIIYLLASLIAGVSLVIALIWFNKSFTTQPQQKKISLSLKNSWRIINTPHIRTLSLILFITQISWSIYYQFMPPVLKLSLHFSATQIGWFVGLIAVWLALATAIGARILNQFLSIAQILHYGIISILIGLICTLIAVSFDHNGLTQLIIWLSALPLAVGDVLVFTCITTLYSNSVPSNQQGLIQGLCYTIVSATWALTSILGSFLLAKHNLLLLEIPALILTLYFLAQHKRSKFLPPVATSHK